MSREPRLLAVSMRRSDETSYTEPRDAIARDWWVFLRTALPDMLPVLLPNEEHYAAALCALPGVAGLLLTGGDDVGARPERDDAELAAFRTVRQRGLPVLGVCRGMQFLASRHGGELVACERAAHVATRHPVRFVDDGALRIVNTFHGKAVRLPAGGVFVAQAWAEDGTLEAMRHRSEPVQGIMWHPEREADPAPEDIELVRSLFLH